MSDVYPGTPKLCFDTLLLHFQALNPIHSNQGEDTGTEDMDLSGRHTNLLQTGKSFFCGKFLVIWYF